MNKKNNEVREKLKEKKIHQWELASALGISEATLVRRLRVELPAEVKVHILSVIEKMEVR